MGHRNVVCSLMGQFGASSSVLVGHDAPLYTPSAAQRHGSD